MNDKPVIGLMAGMEDQAAVEQGVEPEPTDTRQHDYQRREPMEEDDDEPNVSEEEQAAYEQFIEAGMGVIYGGGKVQPGILKLLDDDPSDLVAALGDEIPEFGERFNPIIALAATSVIVVREVIARMGEGGARPDDDIIQHAGRAILEDLAENVAREDFSSEEVSQAYLHAVDIYRAVASAAGEVDDEAASAEFAGILNAQEQGNLGEVLPALEGAQINEAR